jgi:hypothetical protein
MVVSHPVVVGCSRAVGELWPNKSANGLQTGGNNYRQAFRLHLDFVEEGWSERRDLNSGPPVPQTGALTGLRYAPPIGWKPFIYAAAVGRARAGRETTIRPQSTPRIRK